MNKKDIKNLLHSMRTSDNDKQITILLGKIDMIDDEKFQEMMSLCALLITFYTKKITKCSELMGNGKINN